MITDDDGSYEHFHGDAKYRFNDHGWLVVTTEEGRRRTYGPMGWRYVEESEPRASRGLL